MNLDLLARPQHRQVVVICFTAFQQQFGREPGYLELVSILDLAKDMSLVLLLPSAKQFMLFLMIRLSDQHRLGWSPAVAKEYVSRVNAMLRRLPGSIGDMLTSEPFAICETTPLLQ